ncbi:MAG: 2OG-Fe(II) oxygenase family protein [bacterium]
METKKVGAQREQFGRLIASLPFFLNPEVFENKDRKREIRAHLASGNLVLIRDALQEAVAQRMFACLDQYGDWKTYENYEGHFHYHHHNIYEDELYPADLTWCQGIFASEETKSVVQELSQRDCSGNTIFSASLYKPGDYSFPHNDFAGVQGAHRQVAFIWHLSKGWQPNWGGHLFWCRTNRYISPSFNSLILFNVGPDSYHHVTQVSPHATSKRLAISGWWTSIDASQSYPADEDDAAGEHTLVELI